MSDVNSGHGIEALHVSNLLLEMLHAHVADHEWCIAHPELNKAIDKASDALADLYQEIGRTLPD